MKAIVKMLLLVTLISTLVVLSSSAYCAPIFRDGFEPGISSANWVIGPLSWAGSQNHEELKGADNHVRTPGINSAREWVNYHVTYNSMHALPTTYSENVYLKVWMFEDNDMAFPGYWDPPAEYQANGFITLLDTTMVNDYFRVGAMGQWGRNLSTRVWWQNCAIETATNGAKVLDGKLDGTVTKPLVPRRQGWRKYSILIRPYTGNAGDVQFYIDDKLVYNGKRSAAPGGAAPVDTIILGSPWWTNETYWYDDVDFGTVEAPVDCATIAEAKSKLDGTWVTLAPMVAVGSYTKSPFPGYFAVEESDRSAALWVSSSYQALISANTNEGEKVSIRGIMYTNTAGERYLDAIQVTQAQTVAAQPKAIGTSVANLVFDDSLDGMLVKIWGKVTGRGQERTGDWRRYITINDGSGKTTKCYYDLISDTSTNPVPNVKNGDYISVVGVAQKEILVSGMAVEKNLWIRKAGDLVMLKVAP